MKANLNKVIIYQDWQALLDSQVVPEYHDTVNKEETIKEFESQLTRLIRIEVTNAFEIEFVWDTNNTYGYEFDVEYVGTEDEQCEDEAQLHREILNAFYEIQYFDFVVFNDEIQYFDFVVFNE